MKKMSAKLLALSLALTMNFPAYLPVAQAELIGTQPAFSVELRDSLLTTTENFLLQEHVAEQLLSLGVSHDQVMQRIQSLTDEELLALSSEIEDAPAGAGVIEVVGIVFIVLIILEVVGAIDLFKKI